MKRTSDYPVLDLIINRWSPRAMSGELITQDERFTLFDAARWAPSSYNNQPWCFIYALRGTPEFDIFLDLLVEQNEVWAKNAAVLILVISRTLFFYNDQYSRTHSFDTGAACENLALQGHAMGLVVHGMEGFDYDRARVVIQVPQEYMIEALYAVGKPGDVAKLPEQLQERETLSDRRPLSQFICKGIFEKK